jgi:hypothetical protein
MSLSRGLAVKRNSYPDKNCAKVLAIKENSLRDIGFTKAL